MQFKVLDRKTGLERTVTPAAYAAKGPKVYEKLATVDDNGNEIGVQSSPNLNTPQVQRSVKGAGPVVVRTQIAAPEQPQPEPQPEPEKQPDPPAEQPTTTEVPQRKKPGPKPGNRKKSISSNSTTDEK